MENKFTRNIIDETIANGFSNSKYKPQYEFYFHVLAQCKVVLTNDIEIAGVNFKGTTYYLYINPETFNELPLNQRLGILKHEMLHILYNHIERKGKRQHELFNVATDCAINQQINSEDLPKDCITPKSLEKRLKKDGYNIIITLNENAETYYDLLPEQESNKSEDGESGESGENNNCNGKDFFDGLWDENSMGDHSKWEESEGDEELRKDITKRMIDKAAEKARGNLPSELGEIMDLWTRKVVVSWKRVLRNIASNKKANKISTIMKKSRRFPNRPDIKGTKKDRTWNLICIIDTSGSVSNEEIVFGLNEINSVCEITNSNMKILQVDTSCSEIEDYNPKKRNFERKYCGGTYIAAGVKYIFDNKIESDGIIVISDMYIESIPEDKWWCKYKKPVIFLSTTGIFPEVNKNHKIFNINDV
jgi:predicted metal-dependent peptidase